MPALKVGGDNSLPILPAGQQTVCHYPGETLLDGLATSTLDFRLPLLAMAAGFGLCVLVGGTLIHVSERHGLVPSARPAATAEGATTR